MIIAPFNSREKMFKLLGPDGLVYDSSRPGTFGGHRKLKVYGCLDCPSALRFIAKGQYVRHRVFFADEPTAIAAGYRPCAKCLPARYSAWRLDPSAWHQTTTSALDT
jgi:methylphosphotriester-DNA--protein-cysteine methyltransferase